MTAIKEVEVARQKITDYIRKINKLESVIENARQEATLAKKTLSDCKSELDALKKKIKDVVQENENFKEAVRHFKELGEKDKREMDKMIARIETLENNQKGS